MNQNFENVNKSLSGHAEKTMYTRCNVALGIDMATYIPILNDNIRHSAKDSDTHVHLIKGFWKLKFWSKFSLYFRTQSFRQNRADSEKVVTGKLRHQYDL